MATPFFPHLVQPQQPEPKLPDWLQGALEAANAFAVKAAAAHPKPPQPDAPAPVGPPTPAEQKEATSPTGVPPTVAEAPNFAALGETVPSVSGIKNSATASSRESALNDAAIYSTMAQQDYENQAAAAVAKGKEEAQAVYNKSLEAAQQDYVRAKEQAVNTAATKLQAETSHIQALSDQEPDTRRWWSNTGTLGKIGLIAGTIAHALGSNPQNQSVAVATMLRLADEDIAIQKETVAKKLAAAREKKEEIRLTKAEELAAAGDDFKMKMLRIDAMDRELQQKALSLGGDARRLAQIEGTRAMLASSRAKIVNERGDKLAARESQSAGFAHAERMARDERAFKLGMANLEADADKYKDLRVIPPEMGNLKIIQRDPNGKPVVTASRVLHKDYVTQATDVSAQANEMYRLARSMLREIRQGDNLDLLLANNPKLNQDFQLLSGYIATDPKLNKGSTTGEDYKRGGVIPLGKLLDEGWGAKGINATRRREMAVEGLEYFLEKMQDSVNNQLQRFPTPNGDSLYWDPPSLNESPDREVAQKYMRKEEIEAETANVGNVQAGREQLPRGTNLRPISNAQAQALEEAESQAAGATRSGMLANVRAKLEGASTTEEEKAAAKDAVTRYVRANEKQLLEANKREYAVATKLANEYLSSVGFKKAKVVSMGRAGQVTRPGTDDEARKDMLRKYVDPSSQIIREEMAKAGFSPGKLSPEDYANVKKLAEEIVKKELQSSAKK